MAVLKIFGVKPSKLRVASGTALVDVSPYVNAFSLDPNIEELEFPYDGTSDTVQVGTELSGTIGMGKLNTDILDKVVGAVAVTAGLPAAFTSFWHPELGTYPYVQAEIYIRVQDDSNNGAEGQYCIIVWKLKLQNPYVPGAIGNLEANNQELTWSSTLTATDVLGATIPGVTGSNQVHYTIAKVA